MISLSKTGVRFTATAQELAACIAGGGLVLSPARAGRERLNKFLTKYSALVDDAIRAGRGDIFLDVVLDLERRRSLDANALMWALYTVIADYLNSESRDRKRVTTKELYDADMEEWAPKASITVPMKWAAAIIAAIERAEDDALFHGKVVKRSPVAGGEITLEIWKTSSYWTVSEMNRHIDRLIMAIGDLGISRAADGDLDKLFADIQEWKNNEGLQKGNKKG